jgi:sugar/nucleoside kinase (ribokinase family)
VTSSRILFVGRATLDAVYSLDHFPVQDTKVFARALRVAPVGPAVNAALTHALLGGRTELMAAVGGGPWAGMVRSELERRGIEALTEVR